MKKTLTLTICLIALLGNAKADEKIVYKEMLPKKAVELVEKYFPNERISYIELDKEFFSVNYDVMFVSGTSIDFNKHGEWREISCYKSNVPSELIPRQILIYVNENENSANIVEIDKTDKKGYEIKLENQKEIEFNEKFKVIEIDN